MSECIVRVTCRIIAGNKYLTKEPENQPIFSHSIIQSFKIKSLIPTYFAQSCIERAVRGSGGAGNRRIR